MSTIEEKAHARLSPSSADRWMRCPGSFHLADKFPNTSSKYADLGTMMHEVGDMILRDGGDAEDFVNKTFTIGGKNYQFDMEHADVVNTYVSYVYSYIDTDAGDVLMSEQGVPLTQITGEEGAEGTSDVIGVVDGGKRLVVADLKTGRGVQVYAYVSKSPDMARPSTFDPATCTLNPQPAMYAGGALHKYAMLFDEIESVTMLIIQPPLNWVDEVTVSVEYLREYLDGVSVAAAEAFADEGQTLVPGEKQCTFCAAKKFAACNAVRNAVVSAIDVRNVAGASTSDSFADLTPAKQVAASIVPADAMTNDELAKFMRAVPLIDDYISAARSELTRRLMGGEDITGYKLVEGKKGHRKWRDEDAVLAALTKRGRLKKAEALVTKVISPTEAEKLFKKNPKAWGEIAPLYDQAPGKPAVALASDPAPAIQIASDTSTFADLAVADPTSDPFWD